MLQSVSKRFFVTLPDYIGDALDRWANVERSKPATLAAFLLEKEVREAIEQGKIPADVPAPIYKSIADLVGKNRDALSEYNRISETRIEALAKGDRPNELEIARIALALRLDESYIESLIDK
jgi:hypothetical protein